VKKSILSALIASSFAALVSGQQAQAGVLLQRQFIFQGMGVSGNFEITAAPNGVGSTDPNLTCGQPGNDPCRADPPNAYKITDITGVFSDSNTATPIVHAKITGLVPISPTNEHDLLFDPYVPASLSFLSYAGDVSHGGSTTDLSYDNLFYPQGSPVVCDWPFVGTLLDVYGVAFTIEGGYTVDFWGDGNFGEGGALTYGVGVTDGLTLLDYQFAGISVPEPGMATLFIAGMGLLVCRRKFSRSGAINTATRA